MKITLVLVILTASYGLAAGNFLWDVIKGVSEGIEDSLKKGEGGKIKDMKEKLDKQFDKHPKFKHHKAHLEKLFKKAGEDIDKLNKKLVRRYGSKGLQLAKESKFNKHIEAINTWMSTLTKNDTDGEKEHSVPFLPHIVLHKDENWGNRRKEKAKGIFESLKKMWDTNVDKKKEEPMPEEHNVGFDYKEIIPDFVKKDFEKQSNSLKNDKLKQLHKIDLPEEDEKSTLPKFVKDELGDFSRKEMLGLDKELKMKEKVPEIEKLGNELLGQTDKEQKKHDEVELIKMVSKESADLEKTVEELLPFLGDKTEKEEKEVKPNEVMTPKHVLLSSRLERINENPVNAKTKEEVQGEEDKSTSDEMEEEMMSTKKRFMESEKAEEKDVEKKVSEEKKAFEEAEKLWESEIEKNAMEEIRKIEAKKQKAAEEKEINEQLKEEREVTFTPPDEVVATVEPKKKKGDDFKPIVYFNFDEVRDEMSSKKEDLPKEEKIFPLPVRVQEPASLFKSKKESESAFDEISPEIQPLFQRLDDALSRKKILREEKQWMKLKKWVAANLLNPKKSKDSE